MQHDQLEGELGATWSGVIENAEIRGKLKRALHVYGDKDVREVVESLQGAPPAVETAWLGFYEQWATAEVQRLLIQFTALENENPKAPWEVARKAARRSRTRRLEILEDTIVQHVRRVGGSVDYVPARLAKLLSKSARTLTPARVATAMRLLCNKRVATKVRPRRGAPPRFELLEGRTTPTAQTSELAIWNNELRLP